MKMFRVVRIVLSIVLVSMMLTCVGCQKEQAPPAGENASSGAPAGPAGPALPALNPALEQIHSVPASDLDAMGPKNELAVQWIYPNAWFVEYVAPSRFMKYSGAEEVVRFFGNNPSLIPFWQQFKEMDTLLISNKFAVVPLLDPKSGQVISPQSPLPSKAVYMKKTIPVDRKAMSDFAFKGIEPDKIKKENYGGKEVLLFSQPIQLPLDQEGKQVAKVDDIALALHFPDDKSVVFVTGPGKDVKEFFEMDSIDKRGPGAQRASRIDVAHTDFAFLMSYDHALAMAMPLYYPDPLGTEIHKGAKYCLLSIDANAPAGKDVVKMAVDCKNPEALSAMQTALGNTLMQMAEQANQAIKAPAGVQVPAFVKGLDKLVKSIRTESAKTTLTAVLANTPDVPVFFSEVFKDFNATMEKALANQRYAAVSEQIFNLGRFMTNYYSKHGSYPPASIRDKNGTPLLSWRVAILPEFGPQGEALYKQFKLDEPWNSDNNIKLLDKIPSIYVSPLDSKLKTKTTFQVFTSPDTPFGSKPAGLKIQDIANPGKTFMIVSTRGDKAIEWTRPEELSFKEDKLTEIFGDMVVAVPFMGDVMRATFSGKPEGVQKLSNLIRGQEEVKPEAKKADAPKVEVKPEAKKADAPKVEVKPEAKKADAPKVEVKPEAKKADAPKADVKPEAKKP
ncbi:MAG: DUF1559 domain-containing protein [Thermoguttaceae bacterium]|nr:DUF1559 domain-containing protein [Thermoguttaceae bacterium]